MTVQKLDGSMGLLKLAVKNCGEGQKEDNCASEKGGGNSTALHIKSSSGPTLSLEPKTTAKEVAALFNNLGIKEVTVKELGNIAQKNGNETFEDNELNDMLAYLEKKSTKNKNVMLAAVKKNVDALEHANKNLKNIDKFMYAAVEINAKALLYANTDFTQSATKMLTCVELNVDALKHANKSLTTDDNFMLLAVTINADALKYVDKQKKEDPKFMLDAARINVQALKHADESLTMNADFMLAAAKINVDALLFADGTLLKDKDFIQKAVQEIGASALNYADESVKYDKHFQRFIWKGTAHHIQASSKR